MATIFTTTFDIPAWTQTDGLSDAQLAPSGDGIAGDLGNTTTLGAEDQIASAANNSAGGGGLGFRHWVGDGLNNNGGGIRISFAATTEMWVRYYIKHPLGFAYNGSGNMKTIYANGDIATFYFGYFFGEMGGHIENDSGFGTSVGNHLARASGEYAPFTLVAKTFADWQGGATGDGQWHYLELHVKVNSAPAVGDGIFEFWVDGVKCYSNSGCRFNPTDTSGWTSIRIGSNQNEPANGADMPIDFDDIVVSNSGYIGPLAGATTHTRSVIFLG